MRLLLLPLALAATLTATVTASAPKLTLRRRGRTITLTRSVRPETNYGQSADPVEYSMPYASDTAAATLRKYKRSATVTLTVKVTGAGGYRATLVQKTKLAKG